MLPRENRLKHMKDWDVLFKEGRFAGGAYVTLKIMQLNPDKFPRRDYSRDDLKIGFAVGKKVHKSAVRRNRIKRQMREVVRLYIKDKRIKPGYIVGIIAKPAIVGKSYEEIEKDLHYTLIKARLLTPHKWQIATKEI